MKAPIIVQRQEMKIRGLLISVKMSKTVSMVKSKMQNLSRLWLTLKMKIYKNRVIICIYTHVIVTKMKINEHLWEVLVTARTGQDQWFADHNITLGYLPLLKTSLKALLQNLYLPGFWRFTRFIGSCWAKEVLISMTSITHWII